MRINSAGNSKLTDAIDERRIPYRILDAAAAVPFVPTQLALLHVAASLWGTSNAVIGGSLNGATRVIKRLGRECDVTPTSKYSCNEICGHGINNGRTMLAGD